MCTLSCLGLKTLVTDLGTVQLVRRYKTYIMNCNLMDTHLHPFTSHPLLHYPIPQYSPHSDSYSAFLFPHTSLHKHTHTCLSQFNLVPIYHLPQLALTAASPIHRGYLADVDCRWDVISASADCRTREERGLEGLSNDSFVIPKSRHGSVDCYLSKGGSR